MSGDGGGQDPDPGAESQADREAGRDTDPAVKAWRQDLLGQGARKRASGPSDPLRVSVESESV
jgi:hypothetical protein